MRRVLLLGASSMLGWSLVRQREGELTPVCNPYLRAPPARGWERLRLEDEAGLEALVRRHRPEVVIHAGGICDVGKCEANPGHARLLNVDSLRMLLRVLPRGARLVYCSSDHVFGDGGGILDESATPRPISEYGRTRAMAESLVLEAGIDALVVRSALGIGPSLDGRRGHLDWLRSRHRKALPMTVVQGEVRSAVWARDLAHRVWALAMSALRGIRHVTADRAVSRVELATKLNERFGIGARFAVVRRQDCASPHIGDVTLTTSAADDLALPLPSPCAIGFDDLENRL